MENKDDLRVPAMAVMWIAVGFGIGLSNVNSGELNIYNALISMTFIFGAVIASLAMWQGVDSAKAKRDQHSSASDEYSNLLMQLMTEEERQTIRTRLINTVANDGELPSSAELHAEKSQAMS